MRLYEEDPSAHEKFDRWHKVEGWRGVTGPGPTFAQKGPNTRSDDRAGQGEHVGKECCKVGLVGEEATRRREQTFDRAAMTGTRKRGSFRVCLNSRATSVTSVGGRSGDGYYK